MNSRLRKIIQRAETWSKPAQDELVQAALEIEAEQQGLYHATADELHAIDAALDEVDRGEIASPAEVEASFRKLRRG
jgi:hypothetical protein